MRIVPRGQRLPPEEHERRLAFWRQGLTDPEIAQAAGLSLSAIVNWRWRAGLRRVNKRKKAVDPLPDGWQVRQIDKPSPEQLAKNKQRLRSLLDADWQEDAMGNRNSAAEIELRLEKAQRKTAQAGAYFASFQVGDRVEVTTHRGAKQGQIILTHPKFITVVFDGHGYKTTLSRADYLTRQYQIKKIEEVSQVVRKREIPPKAELQSVFEKCGYKIDALAKHYCIAWLKARAWLQMYGLIDVEAKKTKEEQKVAEINGEFESLVIEEVEVPFKYQKEEPLYFKEAVLKFQAEMQFALLQITEMLTALDYRMAQCMKQDARMEFKDVADLAERMHRVWIDARR